MVSGNAEHGVSSAKGAHQFEARAGHHLAPASLATGQNVFEVLGAQFTLLALGASAQDIDIFRQAARSLGMALTVVHDEPGSQADRYQARWVLVRPDQFVAWVGQDITVSSDEARRLLGRASGRASALTH